MVFLIEFILIAFLVKEVYYVLIYGIFKEKKYPIKHIIRIIYLFIIMQSMMTNNVIANVMQIVLLLLVARCSFSIQVKKISAIEKGLGVIILTVSAFFFFPPLILASAIFLFLIMSGGTSFLTDKENFNYSKHPHYFPLLSKDEQNKVILKNIKNQAFLRKVDSELAQDLLMFKESPEILMLDKRRVRKLIDLGIDEVSRVLKKKLKEGFYSLDHNDYLISPKDFQRSNDVETYFNKFYKFKLLSLFDSSCVKTHSKEQIEIDHLLLPKSKGGNFLLLKKNGTILLNAVPLHKSVNAQKGSLSPTMLFTEKEIEGILTKLQELNKEINQDQKLIELLKTHY